MMEEAPKAKAGKATEKAAEIEPSVQRLLDQRKELNAAIRAEKGKAKAKARKLRNRRGVLTGLAIIEWLEGHSNPAFAEQVQHCRDWFLTKPDERALFGLPPRLEIVTPKRRQKARAVSAEASSSIPNAATDVPSPPIAPEREIEPA